ncbi:hypothetical protein KP803_03105 [Vibrio sp. ZSDE26]|uniref:MSHA biogenesis protein MshN n=1 Tax=Vibrio amylolyticus TaxID=2847292 RepID=A0A9X1XFR8_9VIBR|nr:hypothetical protein [Vibrio amylolyticus]MCK6262262.1 hypothetical protein [Vibrio amylolyticus]
MSTINQALSELSEKEQGATTQIEKAHIEKVKSRPVLPWVIGGFSLSLAIGGWAVSQQSSIVEQSAVIEQKVITAEPVLVEKSVPVSIAFEQQTSVETSSDLEPITSVVEVSTSKGSAQQVIIYKASTNKESVPVNAKVNHDVSQTPSKKTQAEEVVSKTAVSDTSILLASNNTVSEQPSSQVKEKPKASTSPAPSEASSAPTKPKSNTVIIEQVELTPVQLAEKAVQRARKAIDSNNIDEALSGYSDALRYTPRDENVRQQLAALYYGKGNARQAFEILQEGIKIDNDSEVLRIALAKLLIKEQQHEAALTPLMHLNHQPSVDYLSLRAALAQKNNFDDIALETYQQLVAVDESNARWWLGLAIQQERNADIPSAEKAYQQALTKVGLSRQSQTFVRERLKLITTLQQSGTPEENSSAN